MNKRIDEIKTNIKYPITLAKIDNQYTHLKEKVPEESNIELLDITHSEARRTYERTLVFLLDYIAKKNKITIKIEHSYGDALFARYLKGKLDLESTKKQIKELIEEDRSIERLMLTKLEAMHLLQGREDDINILKHISRSHIPVYRLDNFSAYFAGPLLPRTGYITIFDLIPIENGFLVILPSSKNPDELGIVEERKKLFNAYSEAKEEAEILEVWDVARLNDLVITGNISNIVKVAEAIHTEKITQICTDIVYNNADIKIVMIGGPSSSGKTTFSKRLGIHLRLHDKKPIYLSLDDYFLDRQHTPRFRENIPFFDAFEAIDTESFRYHIDKLIKGEEIEPFRFDFKKGERNLAGEKISLNPENILIIEGLHAFNPELMRGTDVDTFNIYVSCLTQLNINRVNRIPTRDVRLLRRIFRDTRFRGYSAEDTLRQWESVKVGEEQYIFPYQERADRMFNSSLVYELAVLKNFLETPLRCVEINSQYYCESLRLLNFLEHFLSIREDEIPPTSILREFIGGSTFYY